MKKYILALSILFAVASTAQAQFTLQPYDETDVQGSSGEFELITHSYVKNTGSAKKTFVWKMYRKNFPSSWEAAICDINLCYDISVSRAVFELNAGDSGNLDVHLYPNQMGGGGLVTVEVFEEGDSANGKTQDYDFNAWTLGVNGARKGNFEIYPNPATNKLNITLDTDKAVTIEIYNVLGQLKKTVIHNGGTKTIELNDLSAGIYFLRYTNEQGKVISKQFKKIS